jgi:hypothetical protein
MEISLSEPNTLVRNGKTLAQPPLPKMGSAQAPPDDHSEVEILRLVGALNRLKQGFLGLCHSPGTEPAETEAAEDLAQHTGVAAASRELPSFLKKRNRLVVRITDGPEVDHNLSAHTHSLCEARRRLRESVQELS